MTKLLKSLKAHSDKAWSVSSHEKLPLLATASSDKTSKIYQLSLEHNFPLVGVLEETHKRSVRSVAFKPQLQSDENEFIDLPALASGSFDSTISIWGIDEPEDLLENEHSEDEDYDEETKNKREVDMLTSPKNEWNLMALIEGHENEIKAVAWNKSGKYLASCSRDKTVWIWETDPETLEEFECISVLSDHEHDIKHIVWHPQYNILASSSYDDTVRLYQQDADDEDWSLVSASDDGTVRVWGSEKPEESSHGNSGLPSSIKHESAEMNWELEQVLPAAHRYAIYSVSWSAKSGRIASAGADGLIVIYKQNESKWEIESSTPSAHGVYEINCVSWCNLSNGTEVLVSAGDDGNINIWEV
ncbi:hypothetical protein JCM33374_g65 [Metschnikowia sp. JCM 33374]|nr:hypothetical protein JCM33374_g65 [Metschnikowia sp. JCM 33374]